MEARNESAIHTEQSDVPVGIDALTETDMVKDKPEDDHGTSSKQTSESGQCCSVAPSPHLVVEGGEHHATTRNTASQSDIKRDPNSKRGSQDYLSPKKSRRVSFPTDMMVVSGYMDPPNPWNDVSSCSTNDLMAAYLEACEKHNVKPLPNLVNQLMAITNFCDRNETLTLKGERLDVKHCETLEEVLRRVQFRTIDLENTHIDEESAVAIFDMIEYYESCTKVNISLNKNIGIRGWQSCARMMKKTPCLECLDARSCGLTEQVMPMLGRALRMGSQLTTLHLENSILSGRPLMILVTAIKLNEILRELFLADNKLMPSDGIQLGNMLKYNHKLSLLDIRNNHLQDVGVNHLCDGLFEQNLGQGLVTLVLWNNQVTYQCMPSLSRALSSTQSLETLNLGHNNLTNEGIHRLKEGLLLNKSLLRIGLQAAKISCEGAVALAEYIADSPRLMRIDLRENDIKTGGLMALSLSLKVSQSVTRVDLDKDTKRESGMKDYAEQQRRLQQDIQNYMLRNRDLTRQRELEAELQRQNEAERAQQEEEEAIVAQQLEESALEEVLSEVVTPEISVVVTAEADVEVLRPPIRELHLQIPSRTQTLESPGFVREAELPIISPPSEEQVAAMAAALSTEDIPVEFPPSPMTSQPKTLLTPVQEDSPPHVPKAHVTTISPNSRRKFIISKVVEAGSSGTSPSRQENHSTGVEKNQVSPASRQSLPVQTKAETQTDVSVVLDSTDIGHSAISDSTITDSENNRASSVTETMMERSSDQNENMTGSAPAASMSNGASGSDAVPTGDVQSDPSATSGDAPLDNVSFESNRDENLRDKMAQSGADGDETARIDTSQGNPLPGGAASKVAPNFYTNLSLNGMKVELATVLDNLEKNDLTKDTIDAENLSNPDDFEKELDEMLADVLGPDKVTETAQE